MCIMLDGAPRLFIPQLTLRPLLYNEFNLLDSSSCLISRLSLAACIYLLPSKNYSVKFSFGQE